MSEEAVDYRIEHKRMLNRERQRRFSQRQRMRETGVLVDDNGKPNARLTRLAHNIAKGLNDSAALREAGFSENSRQMLDKAKAGLADILKAKGLTLEQPVETTLELLAATSPMITQDGCIERPAWEARDKGVRHAIALLDRAGELPAATSQSNGAAHVSVTYQTLNVVVLPQDVVDEGQFTSTLDAECSEVKQLESK